MYFIGNPIVLAYQSVSTVPAEATFHRAVCQITVSGLMQAGQPLAITFPPQSHPISVIGQNVEFDISPEFCAYADSYQFQPVTLDACRMPLFTAHAIAYDEFMLDGRLVQSAQLDLGTHAGIFGRYTDFERHLPSQMLTFSRKPVTEPELVFPGDPIVYADHPDDVSGTTADGLSLAPSSIRAVAPDSIGSVITLGSLRHRYYVTAPQRDSFLFQFVNSRGCIETIRSFGLPTEVSKTETVSHTLSRFERFSAFTRTLTHHTIRPQQLRQSSGFVTPDWARWWVYEFCQSEHVWMRIIPSDGASPVWIPCSVSINDETTIIDRTKTEMLHVDFTVTPDLNGPMW